MNPYKLKAIVEYIRRQGRLPEDQFGNVLPPADILVLCGLNDLLSVGEQRMVRREL